MIVVIDGVAYRPIEPDTRTVGETIAQLRREKGYTKKAFAAKLGITPMTLRKCESGDTDVLHTTLVRCLSEFGLSFYCG